MKKFLINILPYLLLALIVTVTRYEYGTAGSYTDTRSKPNVNTSKISNAIVILGDSRSKAGFLDTVMNEHTNRKVYNLSFWGAMPLDNIRFTSGMDIKNSTIFLCVSSRIFLYADSVSELNERLKPEAIYDFNLYTTMADYYVGHADARWEYTYQVNGSLLFKNRTRPWKAYSLSGDSALYNKILNDPTHKFYTAVKLRHFIQLYKLLSVNNKVLLIDLPERVQYREWVRAYEAGLFSDIAAGTGAQVHSFGSYGSSYFYDSHHLNYIGIKKFTLEFVATYNQELGNRPGL